MQAREPCLLLSNCGSYYLLHKPNCYNFVSDWFQIILRRPTKYTMYAQYNMHIHNNIYVVIYI